MLDRSDLLAIREIVVEVIDERIAQTEQTLRAEISQTEERLRTEISQTEQTLRTEISQSEERIRSEFKENLHNSENMLLKHTEWTQETLEKRFHDLEKNSQLIRLEYSNANAALELALELQKRVENLEKRIA